MSVIKVKQLKLKQLTEKHHEFGHGNDVVVQIYVVPLICISRYYFINYFTANFIACIKKQIYEKKIFFLPTSPNIYIYI